MQSIRVVDSARRQKKKHTPKACVETKTENFAKANIFARGSCERAPIALLAKCELLRMRCIRGGDSCQIGTKKRSTLLSVLRFFVVTRRRIELLLPPWKGGVLAAWPTGLLVAEVGFEPTTDRVWTGYSSQLSYSAINIHNPNAWLL